jgi:hypothetical protein
VAKRLKQAKIANLCFALLPNPREAQFVLTVVIRSTRNEEKSKVTNSGLKRKNA